jgi:hypothetical protein
MEVTQNVVKIIGGLGNQMFQYAFFLSQKKICNDTKIDISDFSDYTLHQGFELQKVFGINFENDLHQMDKSIILKDEKKHFKLRKIIGSLLYFNPNRFIKRSHFIEQNYSKYYEAVYDMKNVYFDGYWQSEKYFNEIEENIIETYNWGLPSDKNLKIISKMESENSIALHIRRYDTPKNFKELRYRITLQLLWRVCTKKYYMDSIDYFSKSIEKPKFYIFTDNIPWVKKHFPAHTDYKIIDWNRNENSHWDMYLMSKCKHNIISMSSFSWWSAWLNRNPDKIVIAPRKWALRFSKDIDLIPNTWLRF